MKTTTERDQRPKEVRDVMDLFRELRNSILATDAVQKIIDKLAEAIWELIEEIDRR